MKSPKPSRRTVVLGLSSLTIGIGSAGCLSTSDESEPEGTNETDSRNENDSNGEELSVSVDGLTFGSDGASCGIVFVPQINMDRASWTEQGEALTSGERFGIAIDPDDNRPTAIRDAIAYLRTNVGVDHVVLIGASIGGEAAVVAAADAHDDVAGVIALSPGGGADRASEIRASSLFVVAEGDDDRFVETTGAIHENAPEPTRLEVLPGDAHGQRLFETNRGDDLETWIDELIETACTGNNS